MSLILSKDKFPEDLGGGLENDLTLEDPTFRGRERWSVAIANKTRLKKAESEEFRLKLEELTGLKWKVDSVSSFVFHYVNSKEKTMAKKGPKKGEDLIVKTNEPHILPCKLSEKDRAEAADKLATALQRIDSLSLEKKAKVDEFKGLITAQEESVHRLTVEVKDGVAMRSVKCELRLNYSKLNAILFRFDLEEIVEERPMSEEEKQMQFDY